jgi:RNA polymerase sigma factor (sigma-70 family)
MTGSSTTSVREFLRQLAVSSAVHGVTDGLLLDRYVTERDEAAFAALVQRHGRLVLNVCRRMLRREHDVEDAFQATFLLLVRRANSIHRREAVASWLYGVAYRVAAKARAQNARRPVAAETLDLPAEPDEARAWRDLRPVLDEEINRLPARYRAPVVLCYLEGKTAEEAAGQLGCARGTVLSRLARARARLRPRLVRRGLALSVGGLVTMLGKDASAVSPALANATLSAARCAAAGTSLGTVSTRATALAEGIMRTMLWTKLSTVAVAVLALAVGVGGIALFSTATPAREGAAAPEPAAEQASRADQMLAKIQETWQQVEARATARNPWLDKLPLDGAYADGRKELKPSPADLQALYDKLVQSLAEKKNNSAYAWRVQQLLALIQADLGHQDKSLEHFRKALDAYPDKTYSEPSKHSFFQHLANEAAAKVWELHGVEEAEKFILKLFKESHKFQYFYDSWWREQYAAKGQDARFRPLLLEVIKVYEAKAESDKENGDLYRTYRRQLKVDLESGGEPEARNADRDPMKKYYVLKPGSLAPGQRLPLLLILPGGPGQAVEVLPFARRLLAEAGRDYVLALLSAPVWEPGNPNRIVWPKQGDGIAAAKFTTETFVKAVYEELTREGRADGKRALVFGWSSGGPPVYATALSAEMPPFAGYYVLASVFRPDWLPPLDGARGKRFYLQQGTTDRVTAIHWARTAKQMLEKHGAQVQLESFEGGHGFAMPDVYGSFRQALRWLEAEA